MQNQRSETAQGCGEVGVGVGRAGVQGGYPEPEMGPEALDPGGPLLASLRPPVLLGGGGPHPTAHLSTHLSGSSLQAEGASPSEQRDVPLFCSLLLLLQRQRTEVFQM